MQQVDLNIGDRVQVIQDAPSFYFLAGKGDVGTVIGFGPKYLNPDLVEVQYDRGFSEKINRHRLACLKKARCSSQDTEITSMTLDVAPFSALVQKHLKDTFNITQPILKIETSPLSGSLEISFKKTPPARSCPCSCGADY